MNFEGAQAHDVADVVKQYFRELPDALLTNKLSETFIAIFQREYLLFDNVLPTPANLQEISIIDCAEYGIYILRPGRDQIDQRWY